MGSTKFHFDVTSEGTVRRFDYRVHGLQFTCHVGFQGKRDSLRSIYVFVLSSVNIGYLLTSNGVYNNNVRLQDASEWIVTDASAEKPVTHNLSHYGIWVTAHSLTKSCDVTFVE